jgi:2-iminobutanoate/2-iminopropanoate deaminase
MSEPSIVYSTEAPAAIGPYSQGIRHGPYVWTSGQIGLDPSSGELVAGDVRDQTRQALANLAAVLAAAGSSLALVVKTTVFLVDMADFSAMNAVYAAHFSGPAPARSTVAVAALPKGARVEVEAVAVVGKG